MDPLTASEPINQIAKFDGKWGTDCYSRWGRYVSLLGGAGAGVTQMQIIHRQSRVELGFFEPTGSDFSSFAVSDGEDLFHGLWQVVQQIRNGESGGGVGEPSHRPVDPGCKSASSEHRKPCCQQSRHQACQVVSRAPDWLHGFHIRFANGSSTPYAEATRSQRPITSRWRAAFSC